MRRSTVGAVVAAVVSGTAAAQGPGALDAVATAELPRTAAGNVLKIREESGGGGPCHYDVECGWFHPSALAQDRRTLPSGNGARCLVGKCECSDEFEDRYGCAKCTKQLVPEYSYSDQEYRVTTRVRDSRGRHIDLCEFPVGGASCEVGICGRNSKNLTTECPGDITCDAGGSGSGMCVGKDGEMGTCVCARHFYCSDCSLHEEDILEGAKCGKYVTGGALCHKHSDCHDANAYCSVPRGKQTETNRPFCRCNYGYTCRRCERHFGEMEYHNGSCPCDAPNLKPGGGAFDVRQLEVQLTASPWDSTDECQVRYMVQRLRHVPIRPFWSSPSEARSVLEEKGTLLKRTADGKLPSVLLDVGPVGDLFDETGKFKTNGARFYIYAVTLPRPNETFRMSPSEVVRSELITLNGVSRLGVHLSVITAALLAAKFACPA